MSNSRSRNENTKIQVATWLDTHFPVVIEEVQPRTPLKDDSEPGTAGPKKHNRWCSATNHKGTKMKQLIRLTLNPLVAVALMILVVGCNKSYNSVISDKENIGKNSAVTIDGHDANGKVTRVSVDSRGHRVVQFTTGSEPLRQGTVRIPGGDVIDLRNGRQGSEILPSGAFIPIESQVSYIAEKWTGRGLALIGIAAVIAAICLRRFLAFRAAAPLIPLIAAVGLALITAYCTHAFLLPAIQELQAKIRPASVSATTATGSQTAPSDGWNGKVRGFENQVVAFLRTPTDAPRLLAFLVMFLVSLPVYACTIAWLFRKLRCQPVVCGLLVLALLPTVSTAAGVKRQDIESTLGSVETLVSRAEDLSVEARRLDKAGLKDRAQVSAVRAYFTCDRASNMEAGTGNEIDSLSAWHASAQTKANLHARLQSLVQRRSDVEDSLAEIAGASTNGLTRIYLMDRTDVESQIRDGNTDEERLIVQLTSLSRIPQALVREHVVSLQNLDRLTFEAGKIHLPDGHVIALADDKAQSETMAQDTTKAAADVARLQNEQRQLQNQLENLRLAQMRADAARPATPHVVVITNQIVEKLVPAPAPAPKVEFVTNTVVVTNHAEVAFRSDAPALAGPATRTLPPGTSTNEASASAVVSVEPPSGTLASSIYANTNVNDTIAPTERVPRPFFKLNKAVLYGVGLVMIVGFGWIGLLMSGRRARVFQLAQNGRPLGPFQLSGADDVIVLESVPHIEHRSQVDGKPSIRPTWRGNILYPGSATVAVNDSPVEKPKRLRPGDRVTAATSANDSCSFDFLGCDSITESVGA